MTATPTKGGCWYCHKKDAELSFSTEFDACVHKSCIKSALADNCPEAKIMARELLDAGDTTGNRPE